MSPLISVIIPCYNLGHTSTKRSNRSWRKPFRTSRSWWSMMVQPTFTPPTCWRPHRGHAPGVSHTERRSGTARNTLIQRSSARFLCALDADDKLHPQYFEKALAAFEVAPDLTFVSTRLQMFGEQALVFPENLAVTFQHC